MEDGSFKRSARRGSEDRLDLVALLSHDSSDEDDDDDGSHHQELASSNVAADLEEEEEEEADSGEATRVAVDEETTVSNKTEKEEEDEDTTKRMLDSSFRRSAKSGTKNRIGLLSRVFDHEEEDDDEKQKDKTEEEDEDTTTSSPRMLEDTSFRRSAKSGTENRTGLLARVFDHEEQDDDEKQKNKTEVEEEDITTTSGPRMLDTSFRRSARSGTETRIGLLARVFDHEEEDDDDEKLKKKESHPKAKKKNATSSFDDDDEHAAGDDDGDGPATIVVLRGEEGLLPATTSSSGETLAPASSEDPPREPPVPRHATAEDEAVLPGAHWVSGDLVAGEDDAISVVDTDTSHHEDDHDVNDHDEDAASDDTDGGIPVARQVLENGLVNDSNGSIATATDFEELPHYDSQSSNRFGDKYSVRNIALIVVPLLVLIIGIVLVFVLVGNRNTDSTSRSGDHLRGTKHQSSSSAAAIFWGSLPSQTQRIIEKDEESPQFRAYRWLTDDPRFDDHHYTLERLRQRFALSTFYYSTGGDTTWRTNTNWLSYETHECNWTFVAPSGYFYELEHPDPSMTAKYARVKSPCASASSTNSSIGESYHNLLFYQNKLGGTLPPETFLLTSLESIILSGNAKLDVALSTQIGQLRQLELLEIGLTNFAGTLPSELGRLTELQYIILAGQRSSQMKLGGSIPSEIGHLTRLQRLYLSQIGLSGSIPSQVGTMDSLEDFHVTFSDLNGTIPDEFGRLTNLKIVFLENNKLTGSIPTVIGQMIALEEIWIFSNRLTGSIPSEFGNLPQLRRLWMYENQLTGTIPTEVGRLQALEELFTEKNKLRGSLPTEVGSLDKLTAVWVMNNDLTGGVPSELGRLSNLYDLHLGGNQFTGTIPQQLGMLAANASLAALELAGNAALTGTVPTQLCSLDGSDKIFPDSLWWREEAFISFDCNDLLCGCDCAC